LVCPRVGDELRQVVGRQILAREQQQRRLGHEQDRRKVGRGIVERRFVERLVRGVRAHVSEHELIAVRRGPRDARAAQHPASAADVLDDHFLAERLRDARGEDAADRVGRPAGGEWHHHRDRAGRPVIRHGERRAQKKRADRGRRSRNWQHLMQRITDLLTLLATNREARRAEAPR
jgi:hypothetical protein